MNKEEKAVILQIVDTLDSVIANLDSHLKEDHKMENHGYIDEKNHATIRYYLKNCHERLFEAVKVLKVTEESRKEGQ